MPKKSADGVVSIISNDKLRQLYTTMLKCRILESHVRKLDGISAWKRKEAVAVAASIDLQPHDTIVAFSGTAMASFLKGVPLHSILNQHFAVKEHNKTLHKSQAECAVATGIAYARSVENKGSVTVVFLSNSPEQNDGGREALRFASGHKLPILYLYGGRLPDAMQAYAYGFPLIPVEGNDAVAIYRVVHECAVRARQGGGPSVIAYSAGFRNDPILKMEQYLSAKGLFTDELKQRAVCEFEKAIAMSRRTLSSRKIGQESAQICVI